MFNTNKFWKRAQEVRSCRFCGKESVSSLCSSCLKWITTLRQSRKDKNVCIYCGKNSPEESLYGCRQCLNTRDTFI